MDSSQSSIFNLPIDVQETVINHLIENNKSLVNLRLTCKSGLNLIDHDDLLWKSKIQNELNFPTLSTARTSGYQPLYRGLSNPDLYVWGQSGNGRLGVHPSQISLKYNSLIMRHIGGIPFPWKLHLNKSSPNVSTLRGSQNQQWGVPVKMVAGGWSFHVLTSKGKVVFWGTMNGETFNPSRPNLRHASLMIRKPKLLDLPNLKIKQLSCGRSHASALAIEIDEKGNEKSEAGFKILEWNSWGIIGFLKGIIPQNDDVSQEQNEEQKDQDHRREEVIMLEAGWDFTCLLTKKKGDGFDYGRSRRFDQEIKQNTSIYFWRNSWVRETETFEDTKLQEGENETLNLVKFINPIRLPNLPTVSKDPFGAFEETGESENEQVQDRKGDQILSTEEIQSHSEIIKVAAGMDFIIVLTKTGLVYKLNVKVPMVRLFGNDHEGLDDQDGNEDQHGNEIRNDSNSQSSRERRDLEMAFEKGSNHRDGLQWELLNKFCLPQEIKKEFERTERLMKKGKGTEDSNELDKGKGKGKESVEDEPASTSSELSSLISSETRITHISAHFSNFAVYSVPPTNHSSTFKANIVLISHQGSEVRWSTAPKVIPELQNRGVISVNFGDWHYGALTDNGEILTWGQWSNGALGVWDKLEFPNSHDHQNQNRRNDEDEDEDEDENGDDSNEAETWTGMLGRIGLPFMRTSRNQTGDMSRLGRPGSIVAKAREKREMEDRSRQALAQARTASTSNSASTSDQAQVQESEPKRRQLSEEQIERIRCQTRRHPQKIEAPTEIGLEFKGADGGGKRKFAFDLAMAGWHSGALAIDRPSEANA